MKHAARRRAPVSSRSSVTTASILPRIEVPAGQPVTLRFLRQDPSQCAEKALFDELGVCADLPVGKPLDVTVTPPRPGEYEFTCQMRMYRGTLVVR